MDNLSQRLNEAQNKLARQALERLAESDRLLPLTRLAESDMVKYGAVEVYFDSDGLGFRLIPYRLFYR